MIFSRSTQLKELSVSIPVTDSLKILGVRINEKLDLGTHAKYICTCKKASQRLYLLRKLQTLISKHKLYEVYISIIRSLLEYSCSIFIGVKNKYAKDLQKVDKQAHKMIQGAQKQELNICYCAREELTERRRELSIKLFQDIEKHSTRISHSRIPKRLKFSQHYQAELCRIDRRQRSFFVRVAALLNDSM